MVSNNKQWNPEPGVFIKRKSQGLENRIVPLVVEFQVSKESDLWLDLVNSSGIEVDRDKVLNPTIPQSAFYEQEVQRRKELKQALDGAKLKITVIVEYEKYI